jgi:Flp pilus assembly protein TadD
MYQSRMEAARKHYVEAIKLDGRFAEAYNNLGSTLMIQGRPAEAGRYFRKALQLAQDHKEAQSNLKACRLILETQNKRILELQQQMARGSMNYALHLELGKLFKNRGELDKALDHFHRAVSLNPKHIEAFNELGLVYARKGDYQQARSMFKATISRKPELPEAYYYIAGTYARQNRTGEAVAYLRQAVDRGYKNWDVIKTDRNLESIRENAYYRSLIVDH